MPLRDRSLQAAAEGTKLSTMKWTPWRLTKGLNGRHVTLKGNGEPIINNIAGRIVALTALHLAASWHKTGSTVRNCCDKEVLHSTLEIESGLGGLRAATSQPQWATLIREKFRLKLFRRDKLSIYMLCASHGDFVSSRLWGCTVIACSLIRPRIRY